jgi:ketosteroid isomerase-like protein
MKRFLVPLYILALTLTGWAQDMSIMKGLDPVDAATEQDVKTFLKQFETVYNFHQADMLASFYADYAVWITPEGQFKGQTAIEKQVDSFHFKRWHARKEVITVNDVRRTDSKIIAVGGWTNTVQEDGGDPIALHGWWNAFLVKDGGGFVIKANSYGVDQ